MEQIKPEKIRIFTDGSADPKLKIGGWVALVLQGGQEIVLNGNARDVTHQQMELQAVISALEYLVIKDKRQIACKVFTDSQYVERLPARQKHLQNQDYRNKKGKMLKNADMLKKFYAVSDQLDIEIIKVPAHQKSNTGFDENRRVDQLARKIVRELKDKIQHAH